MCISSRGCHFNFLLLQFGWKKRITASSHKAEKRPRKLASLKRRHTLQKKNTLSFRLKVSAWWYDVVSVFGFNQFIQIFCLSFRLLSLLLDSLFRMQHCSGNFHQMGLSRMAARHECFPDHNLAWIHQFDRQSLYLHHLQSGV